MDALLSVARGPGLVFSESSACLTLYASVRGAEEFSRQFLRLGGWKRDLNLIVSGSPQWRPSRCSFILRARVVVQQGARARGRLSRFHHNQPRERGKQSLGRIWAPDVRLPYIGFDARQAVQRVLMGKSLPDGPRIWRGCLFAKQMVPCPRQLKIFHRRCDRGSPLPG